MVKLILWEGVKKKKSDYIYMSPFTVIYIPSPTEDLPKNIWSRELENTPWLREDIQNQFPEIKISSGNKIYEVFDKYNLHKLHVKFNYEDLLSVDLSSELLSLGKNKQISYDNN